jgi:anti-sigma28 factor (negative regulator of flagellin synthesis)
MRSHGDAARTSVGLPLPQMKMTPTQEMKRSPGRPTPVDQMSSSPRLREIQQAGKLLAQTFKVRETKIVTLRRKIESGYYSVEAEQMAEKIMKDLPLDLFRC